MIANHRRQTKTKKVRKKSSDNLTEDSNETPSHIDEDHCCYARPSTEQKTFENQFANDASRRAGF